MNVQRPRMVRLGWSKWLVLLGLAVSATANSYADGSVSFSNLIGGVRQYLYQRDGTMVTTPFVAQLYLQSNDWVAVSQPVPIKSGLILGGIVVIPGHAVSEIVNLRVRVWNGSHYSSYENALRDYSVTGESQTVAVQLGALPSTPPGTLLGAFPFPLTCDQERLAAVSAEYTTMEGAEVPIAIPHTPKEDTYCPGINSNAVWLSKITQNGTGIPGNPPGLRLGTLHGVPDPASPGTERPPFTYIPKSNAYGRDLIYYTVCYFCDDFSTYDAVAVTVLPSPARSKPTLVLATPTKPALLGLDAHQYRIDRSTDLKTWEPAGTVSGNYSTVDLSSFVTAGASAHFLRATDITTP